MQSLKVTSNKKKVPALGVIVDLETGTVLDAYTGKPCPTTYNHHLGATVMVKVPFNLDHIIFKSTKIRLARLVCYCQHGRPPSKHHIAYHVNGCFEDNRGSNLIWDDGTISSSQAVISGKHLTKLYPHITTIRTILASGYKNMDAIAETFGVHPSTIRAIRDKRSWKFIESSADEQTINSTIFAKLIHHADVWERRDEARKQNHRSALNA